MLTLVKKVRNFGVNPFNSDLQNGKIRLTNGVGLIFALLALVFVPVWGFYDKTPFVFITIFLISLVSISIPIVNKYGFYKITVFLLGYLIPIIGFIGPLVNRISWGEPRMISQYFAPQLTLLIFFPVIMVIHEKRNWNFYTNVFLITGFIISVELLHSFLGFGLKDVVIVMEGFPIFLLTLLILMISTFVVFELSNRMTVEYQQKFWDINDQLQQRVEEQTKEIIRHETFLRNFHAIITTQDKFNLKINNILALGCKYLELDLGILSRIQNDTYEVRNVYDINQRLQVGTFFKLGDTICDIVIESGNLESPTHLHYIRQSKFNKHPAYHSTNIKSYIGIPIILKGTIYGTLNFSSHSERKWPFNAQEMETIKLIGQTINYELSQLQAKKEILKSQRLFANIASISPVGIYRTDHHGNCIYVNEKWCAIAGLTREQAEGAGWVEGIHPKDRAQVFEQWEKSRKENKKFQLEYRFHNSQKKETTWVYGEAVADFDQDGNLVGYVGTITDLSKIKKTEEELRKLSLIAKETDNGVVITDAKGKVEWINQGYSKISGYTLEEIKGNSPGHFLSGPETSQETREKLNQAIRNPVSINAEILNYAKDKTPYWVEINLQPHFNENGVLTNFISIERNITERVNYKNRILSLLKTLEDQNDRLQFSLMAGNLLAWELNLVTNEMQFLPAERSEEVFGKGREIKFYNQFIERMHPQFRALCKNTIEDHVENKVPEIATELLLKNEQEIWNWIAFRGKVVKKDNDGTPLLAYGIMLDVTKSKNIENHLLNIKELERNRISRELHDSVGQILVAIKILINNLKREMPNEALSDIHELVADAIRETRFIVNELSNTLLENHSVKEAILKLLDHFKKITNMQIELIWEGAEKINDYKIANGLFRIVQEALSNAVKYSKADQVSVAIRNISEINAIIKDNGVGFDGRQMVNSSGFGLNNIQERARLLNGWAEINAEEGKGTEVVVRLPEGVRGQ